MRLRSVGIAVAVAVALLSATLPVVAQTEAGKVTRVTLWKAKPGMEKKLEKGVQRHNEWHRAQNDAYAFHTWSIVSGENSGKYLRVAPGREWADFDAEEKWAEADDLDSARNVDPYMEPGQSQYYVSLPALSRPAAGGAPPGMAEVVYMQVHRTHVREFRELMKTVHDAIEKTQWPVHYQWFALANGGEQPAFALVLLRDKWADFKEPDVSFDAMLEKALTPKAAQSVLEKLAAAIQSQRSEALRYRPELSYVPTKP